jgi:hypothetical protein
MSFIYMQFPLLYINTRLSRELVFSLNHKNFIISGGQREEEEGEKTECRWWRQSVQGMGQSAGLAAVQRIPRYTFNFKGHTRPW